MVKIPASRYFCRRGVVKKSILSCSVLQLFCLSGWLTGLGLSFSMIYGGT